MTGAGKKVVFFTLAVIGSALLYTSLPSKTPLQAAENKSGFSDTQKTEINGVVDNFIKNHPEAVMDSLTAFQKKQRAAADQQAAQGLTQNVDKLTASDAPSAGNPNGDVTIVEFFDYNCGYCKRAVGDVVKLLGEDSNIKFIFRDLPILGPDSVTAAHWAVAADKQGKYYEFHQALMNNKDHQSPEVLEKIARDVGLDVDKIKNDIANDPSIGKTIENNMTLSQTVGIHGTPAFIVGNQLSPGYLSIDQMKNYVENARKGK